MKSIRVHECGGVDVLRHEEAATPIPSPGHALVKIEAIGLNFIDVYYRTGLYTAPCPFTPGMEASGIVEATGHGVTEVKAGDRVAYAGSLGAYAEYASVPSSQLVRLPEEISYQDAAAIMLQGMTAHYLTHSTFPLKRGETLLLHAAAGGVGLLLIQMARKIGARIIGTVSTKEKAALAQNAGADHIILYTQTDFESEVKGITGGAGVHVIYDSVGRTTFEKSLNCLRPRGTMVLFGQSSGPVSTINPSILNSKGSLYLTRPGLAHYTASREELLWRAEEVLHWVSDGSLQVRIDRTYELKEVARAHQALEARQTTGKVILLP